MGVGGGGVGGVSVAQSLHPSLLNYNSLLYKHLPHHSPLSRPFSHSVWTTNTNSTHFHQLISSLLNFGPPLTSPVTSHTLKTFLSLRVSGMPSANTQVS